MTCEVIQESLSLYCDDGLGPEARAICYQHLEVCPVCRARLIELRSLRRRLATLSQPLPPADLIPAINSALVVEAAARQIRRDRDVAEVIAEWLQPRVMRYAFSSVASLLLFASVFLGLRPHVIALHEAARAFDEATTNEVDSLLADYDINQAISPQSYAALRAPFTFESPSLNPGGALAALAWAPTHERRSDRGDADEMIVVADVFGNGAASLTDVMQPPRDRRLLEDFQKALRHDAAFVPAALDRRPETMRVVFSVQRVNVRARDF